MNSRCSCGASPPLQGELRTANSKTPCAFLTTLCWGRTFLFTGYMSPFADLTPAEREQAWVGFKTSLLQPKRQAFDELKGIICSRYFMVLDKNLRNPGCDAIQYPEPVDEPYNPQEPFPMLNARLTGETEIETDVVVVGSGCGGGVVAATLAAAGHKVLVLEKGAYYPAETLPAKEGAAFKQLYEGGGIVITDTGLTVLAGSTFGGGSTVNWACSLITPHYVREEWASKHGLTHMVGPEYSGAVAAVCERLGVKEEGVAHNGCNSLFLRGCKALGCDVQVAPQNMRDTSRTAPDAGRISIGDRQRNKQSGTETYLDDARRAGALFLDRCRVEVMSTLPRHIPPS